jgi:hypothetical protein
MGWRERASAAAAAELLRRQVLSRSRARCSGMHGRLEALAAAAYTQGCRACVRNMVEGLEPNRNKRLSDLTDNLIRRTSLSGRCCESRAVVAAARAATCDVSFSSAA